MQDSGNEEIVAIVHIKMPENGLDRLYRERERQRRAQPTRLNTWEQAELERLAADLERS